MAAGQIIGCRPVPNVAPAPQPVRSQPEPTVGLYGQLLPQWESAATVHGHQRRAGQAKEQVGQVTERGRRPTCTDRLYCLTSLRHLQANSYKLAEPDAPVQIPGWVYLSWQK